MGTAWSQLETRLEKEVGPKNSSDRVNALVVGLQHSGKSSVIASLTKACEHEWKCNVNVPIGERGGDDKTLCLTRYDLSRGLTLFDTPGFKDAHRDGFKTILAGATQDPVTLEFKAEPRNRIHCVILIISAVSSDAERQKMRELNELLARLGMITTIVLVTRIDELGANATAEEKLAVKMSACSIGHVQTSQYNEMQNYAHKSETLYPTETTLVDVLSLAKRMGLPNSRA